MTNLSPAAFAIWDAAWDCPIGDCKSIEDARRHQIAAALRAAVDQAIPEDPLPLHGGEATRQSCRKRLLAIADELDGA